MSQQVLVTGGGGYIGSHCVVELIEAGYHPVVVDNFSNAVQGECNVPESLRRIETFLDTKIEFHKLDLLDRPGLEKLFEQHSFYAVMHFAGLKAVGESVEQPLRYYRVNLTGTINLLEVMQAYRVHNLVFSSSATVYGDPQHLPIDEQHPAGGCTNPYGKTKFFIEEMIRDQCKAEKVAVGRRKLLNVFGNDYDTVDGTGVRDYIHVVDLAKGHIAALRKLKDNCGCKVYNLGTGTGYSVLQMVNAMEKVSGKEIPYKIAPRRNGDIASCYADPRLAETELGWKASFGLERMCEDLWRWQSQNPTGFSNRTEQ
uniref:UDP-glucose 4-epimerase n=1 Tax=Electrophorus electricus TaxID=8005 RepID=A0A4W4H1J2_ELEEL